jgi:hypothetical protein
MRFDTPLARAAIAPAAFLASPALHGALAEPEHVARFLDARAGLV